MPVEIPTGTPEGAPEDANVTGSKPEGLEAVNSPLYEDDSVVLSGTEPEYPSSTPETEEVSIHELIKDIELTRQQLEKVLTGETVSQVAILKIMADLDLPTDMHSFRERLNKILEDTDQLGLDIFAFSYNRRVKSQGLIEEARDSAWSTSFPDIAEVRTENITLEDLLASVASKLNKMGLTEASNSIKDFLTVYAQLWSRYDQSKGKFIQSLDTYGKNARNLKNVFSSYEDQMRFLERLEHDDPYSGIEVDQLRNVLQAGLRNSAELYNQIAGGIVASSEEMLKVLRKLEDLVYGLSDRLDSAKAQLESKNVMEEENEKSANN